MRSCAGPIQVSLSGGSVHCLAAQRRLLSSKGLLTALLLAAGCAGVSGIARADEVTFVIRNSHPYAVYVELYSDDRSHVWPGGGNAYYLDDGGTWDIALSCRSGERICYGAWVDGDEDTFWGVGPGNKVSCGDCCYDCEGGETEEINLVP